MLEEGKKAALGALQAKAKDLTAKALARVSERATAGLPADQKKAAAAALHARAHELLNARPTLANLGWGEGYRVASY